MEFLIFLWFGIFLITIFSFFVLFCVFILWSKSLWFSRHVLKRLYSRRRRRSWRQKRSWRAARKRRDRRARTRTATGRKCVPVPCLLGSGRVGSGRCVCWRLCLSPQETAEQREGAFSNFRISPNTIKLLQGNAGHDHQHLPWSTVGTLAVTVVLWQKYGTFTWVLKTQWNIIPVFC